MGEERKAVVMYGVVLCSVSGSWGVGRVGGVSACGER